MPTATVRPYQPRDYSAVRSISYETAYQGESLRGHFSDDVFIADALTAYYTDLEPESLFVAEADGAVIGYITGCRNTRVYAQQFSRKILPKLIRRFLGHGLWMKWSIWIFFWDGFWHGLRQMKKRRAIAERFPAHCHINILPGHQRAGTGKALLKAFLDQLRTVRVPGVHIATATEKGKKFFFDMGFERIMSYTSSGTILTKEAEVWVMGRPV